MSPLERYKGRKLIEVLPDEARLSRNRWSNILGVSGTSVKRAIDKGGAREERGEPPHENVIPPVLTPVEDFPKIIRGFQRIKNRADGLVFHPWVKGIDTESKKFSVKTRKTGEKLVYISNK